MRGYSSGERLLDLEDHLGALPHVVGGGDDLGADGLVGLVGDAAAEAGALLHEDLVAVRGQRARASGDHADAVFARLHFGRNAYDHRVFSVGGDD